MPGMNPPPHPTDAAADRLHAGAGLTTAPANTRRGDPQPAHDSAAIKNMQQLLQLRWIAVVGQVAAIAVVHFGFGIELPLRPMLSVLAGLALFNLLSTLYWRLRHRVTDTALLVGLLVDVGSLTAQLQLSGGITNPFVFLYLLQVGLAAVLLRIRSAWIVAAAASACLVMLAILHSPVTIPAHPERGLADPYVQGLVICFVLNTILLVLFITRIGRISRARDQRLAALRQQAAEEEHIVRMGLLASGAAHELGTPLATLAVILGDWRHLPEFRANPELDEDLQVMQTQVMRCKSIVTNILASAGEPRGEAPAQTTMHAFFDALVQHWRDTRSFTQLDYQNRFGSDVTIVADPGLKQTIDNILDNALESSPDWVGLVVRREGRELVVDVSDNGGGFSDAMLAQLGKPYQSSKSEPGHGLGLFLSVNVARTLGGTLSARNRSHGGALVSMRLPLSALTLDQEEDESDDDIAAAP